MSKTVTELEQEVEALKQQLSALRPYFGNLLPSQAPESHDERSDFSALYGKYSGHSLEFTLEDWLEFKQELNEAFERKFADLAD